VFDNRGNESYVSIGAFVSDNSVGKGTLEPFGKFEAFYLDTGATEFKNDFTGFSIGMGLYLNYFATPYIQAGALMGENSICNNTDSECTDDLIFGVYPKIGLMLYKKEFFVAQLFYKKYLLSSEMKSFAAAGISFGISF